MPYNIPIRPYHPALEEPYKLSVSCKGETVQGVNIEVGFSFRAIELLAQHLKALGLSGTLNTAFIERLTLTLRHALAALSRRAWATAQLTSQLVAHLQWWRAYPQGAFGSYHFCRAHAAWRLKLDLPLARRGAQSPRRFALRTPAMPAGLTDPIWSVHELLAFLVG